MSFVDRLPQISKREDPNLRRFAQFLQDKGFNQFVVIDKPDETVVDASQKARFDYLIELDGITRIALEFTQLFETQDAKIQRIQWGNVVAAFRQEFDKYLSINKIFPWPGIWGVEVPTGFGASRPKARNIARKNIGHLISALQHGQTEIHINGVVFKLKKITDRSEGDIYFSSSIEVGTISPSDDILEEMERLLPVKNTQLDTDLGNRYLVITSKYPLASIGEVISAMSRLDITQVINNIDKIYIEESPLHYSLAYTIELSNAWFNHQIELNDDFMYVFQMWLPHLRVKDPEQCFNIVWRIVRDSTMPKVFPDKRTREEIVHLGDWLLECNKNKELLDLIEKFIDDPDPPEPEEYKGEPDFDYHQQIMSGRDPQIITSVRGYISWIVQKMTLKRELILQSFDYTKRLLRYKNLYAKQQAIIPLIEIAKRKQWIEQLCPAKYYELHDLVFSLMREYSCYKAISNSLVRVFHFFKDITTAEALEVLEHLKDARQSGTLYVYFGIFRQRHFKNPDGTDMKGFEPDCLRTKLRQTITASNNLELKHDIAWSLLVVLKEKPHELETIKPYIELFLQQEYEPYIGTMLQTILKYCLSIEPGIAIMWFKQLITRITSFVETNADVVRKVYLMHTEEFMEIIAITRPSEIIETMGQLVKLWLIGVYIGDPRQLFGIFKLIGEEELRSKTKEEFMKFYKRMKATNPKLAEMKWN